jgi:methyl-accepting chemotaxis protein
VEEAAAAADALQQQALALAEAVGVFRLAGDTERAAVPAPVRKAVPAPARAVAHADAGGWETF